MNELCSPRAVQALLNRFGLKPNKGLGQNFLIDGNILGKIVAAADLSSWDTVVEIGPGLGTLTRSLAERATTVFAIEKDRQLEPLLAETLTGLPVRLIADDALNVDYSALLAGVESPKVVANLPYYVTTPLIINLLRSHVSWQTMVFLVQREVVDRIMARPGTKEYGMLSIVVQYFARPKLVTTVPPGAFFPPPNVASAVVQLSPWEENPYPLHTDEDCLFRIAQASLAMRRKTLLNTLAAELDLPRTEVRDLIAALGWSPDRRGETLSVHELVQLTNRINGC